MTSLVEIIYENTVLEALVLPETGIVEIINPGPQGPQGSTVLTLPYTTAFMRIKATGELQVWNSDQSRYHTLLVQGSAGAEYITVGAGET